MLYTFTGQADGCSPGGLVRDEAGNFYGTAAGGGDYSNCTGGCGTVFKLDPESKEEMVLYTFHGDTDGATPEAGVIRDASGNLYGTTRNNGSEPWRSTSSAMSMAPPIRAAQPLRERYGGSARNEKRLSSTTSPAAPMGAIRSRASSSTQRAASMAMRLGAVPTITLERFGS